MSSAKKIILPFIIIVIGALVTVGLIKMKSAPQKQVKAGVGTLVEIMVAAPADHPVVVQGTGTVQPGREVTLTSQVGGRVVTVSPALVAGGFFKKGELLFAIEAADYELALDQARANVAKAELALATAESRAAIARREWDHLKGDHGQPSPLVLHEPQLKEAAANLAAAKAAYALAELNLDRTRILAPFNCRIRSESVDLGKVLKSGDTVGVLADTDLAEIVVPLSLGELGWLQVPRAGSQEVGSSAVARLALADGSFAWPGRVVRSLGEVDQASRLARVVVAVANPYGPEHAMGLATGLFVKVELAGKTIPRVVAIPHGALRDESSVWVMDSADRLRIKPVSVIRKSRDYIYVNGGLAAGERIVLTSLAGAADGMLLRLATVVETKP